MAPAFFVLRTNHTIAIVELVCEYLVIQMG